MLATSSCAALVLHERSLRERWSPAPSQNAAAKTLGSAGAANGRCVFTLWILCLRVATRGPRSRTRSPFAIGCECGSNAASRATRPRTSTTRAVCAGSSKCAQRPASSDSTSLTANFAHVSIRVELPLARRSFRPRSTGEKWRVSLRRPPQQRRCSSREQMAATTRRATRRSL